MHSILIENKRTQQQTPTDNQIRTQLKSVLYIIIEIDKIIQYIKITTSISIAPTNPQTDVQLRNSILLIDMEKTHSHTPSKMNHLYENSTQKKK